MTSTETDIERRSLLAVLRLERWDLDRLLEERPRTPAQLLAERYALLKRMPTWPGDDAERNEVDRHQRREQRGSGGPGHAAFGSTGQPA